ncbi:MAG: Gx transporter family protein [Candidatus Gastranaerophilales bacterium]|nr:Gx transporter family protein [Candidatus Gastranaerophilales bacterium]
MRRFSTSKLTSLALFATLALAVYAVESALPPPVPLPGVKLGLSNIITLVVLKKYSARDALYVLVVRILLSALLFGQALSLLYSLTGGLLCLAGMSLFHRLLQGHFLPLTSILGAICHNIGQIGAAILITATPGVLSYLPFLILSGILTGLFTGCCAHFMLRLLNRPTSALPSDPKEDDGNSERSR